MGYRITVCGLCKQTKKRVIYVPLPTGTVEVGRCIVCDTRTCERCGSKTFEPEANRCKHCNQPIALGKAG